MKILLIEDEKSLLESLVSYLKQSGHLCESVENFKEGSLKIAMYEYDCVVLDVGLPDGSGFDLIKEIKNKSSETGIIVISAKNGLDDKITGLNIGADDYLTKPFHLSELDARIRSLFRRRNLHGNNDILFNEILIHPNEMNVFVNKKKVVFTKKEYEMLLFFISNQNKVLTKESIAEHLWGDDSDMADSFNFIYSHIKNLRKKLMDNGAENYLHAVYGIGYKFSAA
ncbi:MAG: response regulator transcription factor [Bacteroidia bacterium]